jgi:peptidoglycan hydrolase-like protein with peptidoglycan-binding domain
MMKKKKFAHKIVAAKDVTWVDGSMKWLRIRLPQKASGAVAELREVLQRNGFVLETSTREWRLGARFEVLNFLSPTSQNSLRR